ncbi:MAG: hypothetical protein NC240_11925 [Clostridium sp.]|nr:hypothetical protein [Clostridium sp.]
MKEIEEQRLGRNKETVINYTYINSGEYRKKFDRITENTELSRLLYHVAKDMLIHRSGTKFEDMYWIDLDSIMVVAKEINASVPKRIEYSDSTKKIIGEYSNLLTIHTHPDSFPPSIDDINSNYDHSYVAGIVACHDGRLYMYSANERINENYYKLIVEGLIKRGYNEAEAQIVALSEIQQNFDINFKEVTANDSV